MHSPLPDQDPSRPSRFSVVLSAFVFPGAGQIHQGRWAAAAIFGTGFLVCFVVFVVYAASIIRIYYSIAFDFDSFEVTNVPLGKTAAFFLLAMLVYAVSLGDTQRAYLRECHRRARRRLEDLENGI